jgi:S1-C subfamily serine protease
MNRYARESPAWEFTKLYTKVLSVVGVLGLAAYGAYDLSKKVFKQKAQFSSTEAYSVASLTALLNVPTKSRQISLEESLANISSNLVQVYANLHGKWKSGSGLLLTTDGFVASAYHVIEPANKTIKDIRFLTRNGICYKINNATYLKDNDVTVLKADTIAEEIKPSRIRINANPHLKKGEQVRVLGYRDGQQYNSLGIITNADVTWDRGELGKVDGLFETDVRGIQGQSGGVVVNKNGEVIGITVYTRAKSGEELGVVGASKMANVQRCIEEIIADSSSRMFK